MSNKLNIYVQSNLSGEPEVTSDSLSAIYISGGITINGGKITDNNINGIKAENFNLNRRNADDFIKTNKLVSNNVTTDVEIKISDGKHFYEENGNIYSGTLTSEQLNCLETSGEKTLKPVAGYIVTIFDGVNVTSDNVKRIG